MTFRDEPDRRAAVQVANRPLRPVCDLNGAVAALAARQGGHVTRAQLLAVGLGPEAIRSRTRRGWLIRVHHGVYAVGHLATSPLDRAHGVLLAAGDQCALAGPAAAALWELFHGWPARVHIIGPVQRRIPGVTSAVTTKLLDRDITVHKGLRVTSPARTLLDLAPRLRDRDLHRFHNELRMRNALKDQAVTDVAARNQFHPGAPRLRTLVEDPARKRSVLEIDWARFAKRHRLPAHEMNVQLAGREVDVLFTPERLIVELDGWATHGTRRAYEADRERDARILAETGIPTVRITHSALHRTPKQQAQRLLVILAGRPA